MLMVNLILDTETTGLSSEDEICDLAIIAANGDVLLNTLIKPSLPIPPDATAIHGITPAMVKHAPCWPQIYEMVRPLLQKATVYAYNAPFDVRMLKQTCSIYGLKLPAFTDVCLMRAFSAQHSTKQYRGRPAWVSLEDAAMHYGLTLDTQRHRAVGDALLTWQLFCEMRKEGLVK